MSPEEINVKIAESLGWKLVPFQVLSTKYVGIHSPDGIRRGDVYDTAKDIALQWKQIAPNFAGSLDAIVPVIRNDPDCWAIFTEVAALVDAKFPAATATAEQWSIAYLKTKGLIP